MGNQRGLSIALGAICTAAVAVAQAPPSIVNGNVQQRAVTSSLNAEFGALVKAQAAPAWIGYAVPAVSGEHDECCYSADAGGSGRFCGQCRLEDGNESFSTNS